MLSTRHKLHVLKTSFGGCKKKLSVNQVLSKHVVFRVLSKRFHKLQKRRHMLNLPETFLRPPFEVVWKTFV